MIFIVSTTEEEHNAVEQYLDDMSTYIRDYKEAAIIKNVEDIGYIAPLVKYDFCTVLDPKCSYLSKFNTNY